MVAKYKTSLLAYVKVLNTFSELDNSVSNLPEWQRHQEHVTSDFFFSWTTTTAFAVF